MFQYRIHRMNELITDPYSAGLTSRVRLVFVRKPITAVSSGDY